VLVVATVVIAASIVRMYGNLECIQMEDDWSPEPAATDFIDTNRLQGRMLTWFNWGEYAIWHFSPRILVSMDGRRETVYSEAVRTKHLGFFFNATANRAYATELKADYIWLPKQLPIAPSLVQQGWTRIFVGTRSVIFTRHDAGSRDQSASGDVMRATTGCFPGP
jgi:hypothetical protein